MMPFAQILQGIILSGVFGLAIGNLATNPIYRLPRRESLFLKDPYCGDCNAKLMPKDLFPVFSWLATRGKCRYCGAVVPGSYAAAEAAIGLLFVICFLKAGFSEQSVLVSLGMTAFIMIAMMLHLDNFFSGKTVIAAIVLGALYHTLEDKTIYTAAGGAYAGLMAGALAWKISGKPVTRDIPAFPPYLGLLVAMGVWLPLLQFLIGCIIAALVAPLSKNHRWWVEYAIIAYTIADVLVLL